MAVLELIILNLVKVFTWALLAYCILSMLLGFGIVDIRNRFFYSLFNTLARFVEPILTPIRNIIPSMGNMDFSPMILLLLIRFVIYPLIYRAFDAFAPSGSPF